jgi:hypothetical protein
LTGDHWRPFLGDDPPAEPAAPAAKKKPAARGRKK